MVDDEPKGIYRRVQTTHQETDIISHFALVAVGDADITNKLRDSPTLIIETSQIKQGMDTSGAKG